jgi:N-acyl-D-aspartate/D-glutamate deacylase
VYDVVLRGGRVVDPASGVDALLDVAVSGDRIAAVGASFEGRVSLGATGCVVAPGFVDLHSHAQSVAGHRLQALDGVTTSLELEAGVARVDLAYASAAAQGRPLHYGFSASWAASRMAVLAGVEPDGRLGTLLAHLGNGAWQGGSDAAQQAAVLELLRADLDAGALGIGVIVGYAPGTPPGEYVQVAALAAEVGRPTWTHARDLVDFALEALIDGAEELVRAAGETGAHMHYCHVNSTSLRAVDRVLALVDRARSEGSTVTTEAYPYGAGSTGIGAAFLAPERLAERGLRPTDLVYAPTGERVADAGRLRELRESDPGGLCLVHFLAEDEPADLAVLMRSLEFPDACIASDAMPITWQDEPADDAWPLPPTAFTHPRTAGTFAKAFRRLVRERGNLDVVELVRRASVLPAEVLAVATGGSVRKGTLEPGADADVVVLDPETYTDTATYQRVAPSTGVRHLLVAGTAVVRGGELQTQARPGRAVRAL